MLLVNIEETGESIVIITNKARTRGGIAQAEVQRTEHWKYCEVELFLATSDLEDSRKEPNRPHEEPLLTLFVVYPTCQGIQS